MKKIGFALLMVLLLALTALALAEDAQAPEQGFVLEGAEPKVTEEYRYFINRYRYARGVTVAYYDNVYAVNHGKWGLTPFDSSIPEEYFVVDQDGYYAVAPFVMDVTDAMRIRLYGSNIGELGLLYGQYCERVLSRYRQEGFSGVHEGIDFIAGKGTPLHAILGGVVTRAGDSNGTVGIYNEEYDITLLYLHCEGISVRRGDEIEAGACFAKEGSKGSGAPYTHVEMRYGRHTSSNKYRDTRLESDLPYAVLAKALKVVETDRKSVTYAEALDTQRRIEAEQAAAKAEAERQAAEAERMRLEAEAAAAKAEAERKAAEAEAQALQQAEATPEVELVDVLPSTTPEGYGFGDDTPTPQPTGTPVPEATLPPNNP